MGEGQEVSTSDQVLSVDPGLVRSLLAGSRWRGYGGALKWALRVAVSPNVV